MRQLRAPKVICRLGLLCVVAVGLPVSSKTLKDMLGGYGGGSHLNLVNGSQIALHFAIRLDQYLYGVTHHPMTTKERFLRWYQNPFLKLKELPHGDGAYQALSMGFGLCERFYRLQTSTIDVIDSKPFLKAAAKDYDCDLTLFKTFWKLFRHGLQHQGAPKKEYRADWLPDKPMLQMNWALGDDFSHRPAFVEVDSEQRIGVNPWLFTEFVINKFLESPQLLEASASHAIGKILEPAQVPVITEISFDGTRKVLS